MLGRSTPASEPAVGALEPHEDHGYMPEPVVGVPKPEAQPFSADVSILHT